MSRRRPITSELALLGLSLATVLTCWRLFVGWDWLVPLGAAAVLSHVLSAGLRRAGWGSFTTLVASLLVGAELLVLSMYADTTWYGLPTSATWQAFEEELRVAWEAFPTAVAPVPATGGFLVMALLGVWLVAHLSDDLAHRANTVFEAVVPQALLFVFATALGGDRMRLLAVAVWLLAAVTAVGVLRSVQATGAGWFGGSSSRAVGAGMRGAMAVGLVAVAVGVALGPALPGAGDEPLLDTRQHRSSRTTVSPLVDIKARLVNQSDTVAFEVQADGQAYWRLTALDTFDGEIWRSSRSYGSAAGELSAPLPQGLGRTINQEYEIGDLASVWLPAAFQPQLLSDPSLARFDEGSGSLLVRGSSLAEGSRYAVTSQVPEPDAATVAGAAGIIPSDIAETYLQLPAGFPEDLREEARLRAGTGGAYAQALNLQSYFRTFTYDLNGPTGHGTDAIRVFLDSQRGYCEQFAGTFAAFARSIGLPARVAVGFTTGELGDDGRYIVRGRNAHAWPEVWFPGIGWLPFEPTPGRGVPGGEDYTGVPAEQEGGQPEPPPTTAAAPPTSTAPGVTARPDGLLPDGGADLPDDLFAGNVPSGGGSGRGGGGTSVLRPLVAVLAIGAAAALAWAVAAPLLTAARRRRSRSRATDPRGRVLLAWNEAVVTLRRHGDEPLPSETPAELAARVRPRLGEAHEPLDELAERATVAAFGAGEVPDAEGSAALDLADRLDRTLRDQTGWRRRLATRFDPRLVLSG